MARKSSASRRTKRKAASKTKPAKFVYYFGEGKADGNGKMKPLLGGKAANLAEMTRIGLPVPPGFTISTEVCTYFYAHTRTYPRTMQAEVEEGIRRMEGIMGTTFGDTKAMPLLVAVRSGARDSMPGMMDTILNLGLNDETVLAVAKATNNDRAIVYRRKYNIPQEWGTAVNVQAMVFGNTGVNSGSGVAFSRDPATGEKVFYGEFLINAQGEDVVGGVRTPEPVADLKKHLPNALVELERIRHVLEAHFKDVQDFEFTIQDGKVFMLQTRNGKRTGVAAVKFACDMVREKLIEWKTAITRVPADQLDQVLAPVFDRAALKSAKAIASGLPAGPGAATGRVYFNADRAAAAAHKGEKVLLVRVETSPEDLRGMIAAEGILTARGGVSSHAALVARQMGKVCICGASALNINYRAKTMSVNGAIFREGENYLSIDGTSGTVYADRLRNAPSEIIQGLLHGDKIAQKAETYRNFNRLMDWCSKVTRMSVRTNADTPEQVENAVAFGASGIGLCRTEHMFFEGNRIDAMREMILARKADDRQKALAKLLPYQKGDFVGIFKALKGKPATIRLLDPPLHEFLPQDHAAQTALAEKIDVSTDEIARRVHELHEQNPMLGHRGCRLGISFTEVTEMQARAIFEAAAEVQ